MRRAPLLGVVLCVACGGGGGGPAPAPGGAAGGSRSANAQLSEAREWIRKAAAAPLPTPPLPPSPVPKGWQPEPAPEFKAEEVEAIRLLEQVIAADPGAGEAHLALADLLAPHAVRRHERGREQAAQGRRRGTPVPSPSDQGVDWSDERIVRAYRGAIDTGAGATAPVDGLIRFAERVDRLDDADAGYKDLLARQRENAAPHVRYGDFLRDHRKDVFAAVEQYGQALLWAPGDTGPRDKIADIYLDLAAMHLTRREYGAAEARLKEAARHATDPATPQGARLREQQARLRAIRRQQ